MTNLKISAIALAVGATFSGAASAQTYVAGAGASAQRATAITIYTNTCPPGGATTINANAADGGGNVRAIRCNVGGNIFSYDSDGGSWRAYATNYSGPALDAFQANIAALAISNGDLSLRRIRYLDLSLCPGDVCAPGAAKPVLSTNTGGAPTTVSLGFTDVDPTFMDGVSGVDVGAALNRPRNFTGWKVLDSSQVRAFPSLGVVFGVIASRPLYETLMADQGITAGSNPGCFPAGLADLANPSCAPTITRQQYTAMANANFGSLNSTYANLFLTKPNAASAQGTTVERRDWGSGSQAASNWYFFGVGCTSFFDTPADAANTGGQAAVTENNATADVITRVSAAGTYRVGMVSRENSPTAGGAWGFLKISPDKGGVYEPFATNPPSAGVQGAYPSNNAAARGLYDYWTVAWTFCQLPTTNPQVVSICNTLDSTGGGYAFTPAVGTLNLTKLTGTPTALGTGNILTGTYYSRDGMIGQCNQPVSN